MKVACSSCQDLFEADAEPADASVMLCDVCSLLHDAPPGSLVPAATTLRPETLAALTLPPPSPSAARLRRRRPKVPELTFGRSRVGVQAASAALQPEEALQALDAAPPSSGDPAPISLDDLDVVSSHGVSSHGVSSHGVSSHRPVVHDGGFTRVEQSVFPSDPSPPSRRSVEMSRDDFASDIEPVSLHDLGVVLAPGTAPPLWSGSAGAQASTLRPNAMATAYLAGMQALCPTPETAVPDDAPVGVAKGSAAPRAVPSPLPMPPVRKPAPPHADTNGGGARDSADSGIVDLRGLIASAEQRLSAPPAPPAVREKPSFFRVESVPAPDGISVDIDDEPAPSSSRADLLTLVSVPSDRPKARAAEDLLHLDGGLFNAASSQDAQGSRPLLEVAPLAPVMNPDHVPRSSRRPPPPLGGDAPRATSKGSTPPPRRASASKAPPASPPRTAKSVAPGPVVSERRPAVVAAARRSGMASWAVALAGVTAASIALGFRLGSSPSTPDPALPPAVSSVTLPSVTTAVDTPIVRAVEPRAVEPRAVEPRAVETAKPEPRGDTQRAVAPTPPARATEPAPVHPAEPAPASKERAAVPPPKPPTADAPPPLARPAPTAAPAPAPPPSDGAEFDRAAAKAALAAAASTAAGCKQGDDPSGGARVSITFAPSGRVTSARILSGPFQGTKTGGCIAQTFRTATVPAFSGDAVTVTRDINVQ